ncbi:MAG: lysophospholipid acyltransferase family protein [Bacteroidota bacterium]
MESRYEPALWATLGLKAALFPLMRVLWRPKAVGIEHRPEGASFVVGNHSNNMDPFLINLFTPQPSAGVMAHDHVRAGLFARSLRAIGIFPTRKRVTEPGLVRHLFNLLEHDRSIVIYPQGGRSWDGRPLPWILPSTLKLYAKTGAPVHPVRVQGSYVGWPRWADYPRPARIRVEFLEPHVFARSDTPATIEQVLRPLIDEDESEPPAECRPRWAYKPASGIHRLLYRCPESGSFGTVTSPDGRHVVTPTRRYRMHADSTLADVQSGETTTPTKLYAQLRKLPLDRSTTAPLLEQRVDVYIEADEAYAPLGPHTARLFADRIELAGARRETFSLETIQSTDIGTNRRLHVYTSSGHRELRFEYGGSALGWMNVIADCLHN